MEIILSFWANKGLSTLEGGGSPHEVYLATDSAIDMGPPSSVKQSGLISLPPQIFPEIRVCNGNNGFRTFPRIHTPDVGNSVFRHQILYIVTGGGNRSTGGNMTDDAGLRSLCGGGRQGMI